MGPFLTPGIRRRGTCCLTGLGCLLGIPFWSPVAHLARSMPTTGPGEPPKAAKPLDARLEGTDSEPVLVVELTNTTAEPITVDRELVLCLEVRIQALDGSRLEFERLE